MTSVSNCIRRVIDSFPSGLAYLMKKSAEPYVKNFLLKTLHPRRKGLRTWLLEKESCLLVWRFWFSMTLIVKRTGCRFWCQCNKKSCACRFRVLVDYTAEVLHQVHAWLCSGRTPLGPERDEVDSKPLPLRWLSFPTLLCGDGCNMIDSLSLLFEVFQSGLVPALFRSPFFDLNNYNTEF